MISPEYIAGFFDGEGCIGIYQNGKGTYHLRIQLTQNVSPESTAILSEFQLVFGGNLSRLKRSKTRPKEVYNWQLNGHGALKFLKTVHPFLIVKKSQADVAMEWQSKKRVSPERDALGRIAKVDVSEEDVRVSRLLKDLKG